MTLSIANSKEGDIAWPDGDYGFRCLQGYSLVELLIVNALTLTLVAALFAAAADLLYTAAASSAQSDQAMRARQVMRFIEQTLATARMPPEWASSADSIIMEEGWRTPAPICLSPSAAGSSGRWGGIDVIEMTGLPCIGESDATWGLYVEQIRACPRDCGTEPGYVISPSDCVGHLAPINTETEWQVTWQANMDRPDRCRPGWPWGRLQRVLLTDRSGHASVEGVPTLRFQALSDDSAYKWQPAETLVAGVADWQPKLDSASSFSLVNDGVDVNPMQLLSLRLAVLPGSAEDDLAALRVARLLLPSLASSID